MAFFGTGRTRQEMEAAPPATITRSRKNIKFWTASSTLGVILAYALGIVKYRYGGIRLDDNGTLAILGLIFLSSMALRFVRNFIFEDPPEQEPDTPSKEGQLKTRP